MSTKIYANAVFGFREDTLENWKANNPILEKGEPAVVRDGVNGEWLKIGDGATDFNNLPWKTGPKGDKGEQGAQGPKGDKGEKGDKGADAVTDLSYNPRSENAQSGIAVNEAINLFDQSKQKNYEHIATIKVTPDENGNLPTSIVFSADSDGNPFELSDFCLTAVLGATDGSSARVSIQVNGRNVFGNADISLNADTLRSWYINWMDLGTGILCIAPTQTAGNKTPAPNNNISAFKGGVILPIFDGYSPITSIKFYIMVGTTKTFIEGSEFKLYGVRK